MGDLKKRINAKITAMDKYNVNAIKDNAMTRAIAKPKYKTSLVTRQRAKETVKRQDGC